MEAKQGRLNTAKRRTPLSSSQFSLSSESNDEQYNERRTWKKIKPEEKEQKLISEFYQPASIELLLLSEVDTADSNQNSSHKIEDVSCPNSIAIRKDHFELDADVFQFHEPKA